MKFSTVGEMRGHKVSMPGFLTRLRGESTRLGSSSALTAPFTSVTSSKLIADLQLDGVTNATMTLCASSGRSNCVVDDVAVPQHAQPINRCFTGTLRRCSDANRDRLAADVGEIRRRDRLVGDSVAWVLRLQPQRPPVLREHPHG